MSVTYRAISPEEQTQTISLWSQVLGEPREVRRDIFYDFSDDPQRFRRTSVAVASDGVVCAAMSYWLREVRDDQGRLQRVGHLWGAATLPAYRGQGHATQLANRVLEAMQHEGCHWSILFARDEARPLYERLGWQGFETTYHGGFVAIDHLIQTHTFKFHSYNPLDQGWAPLGAVYHAYNTTRPLALVRTSQYWDGYISWMAKDWITHHRASFWVMTPQDDPSKIVAYTLVHYYDQEYAQTEFGSPPWFHVSEIGLNASEPEVVNELISFIAAEAVRREIYYGHFALPSDPVLTIALQRFFNQPLTIESELGGMMARPIGSVFAGDKLGRMFRTPEALFWEIDRY